MTAAASETIASGSQQFFWRRTGTNNHSFSRKESLMKRFFSLSLITCVLLAVFGSLADAGVSTTVSYRGRLVDASGAPVSDGDQLLRFAIYDAPTAGRELWNSGLQLVKTRDGLFNYHLGSSVALPQNMFSGSSSLYLGITVSTDPEIRPRTEFTSAAYAYQAEHADVASSSQNAVRLGGETPSYYLAWNNLAGIPAGFADGIDNNSGGDITGVTATNGLSGGGTSGSVSLSVARDGITATHIASGAVGTNEVALNSLTASDLAAGSVASAEVLDNSLVAKDLAPGCIGTSEVLDNSLGAKDLAANSVTASEIAIGAVAGSEILDGSIANADISNSAGIATGKISGTAMNLSSSQTASGTKTFSDLRIAATTRRISISSAAFAPHVISIYHFRSSAGYIRVDKSGTWVFYAPVELPEGAIITQLEGTFRDIDNVGSVDITLSRVTQSSGAVAVLAQSFTTPAYNTGNPTIIVDNSISNATVSNETYFYFVRATLNYSNMVDGLRLYGAEVTYTITKPLP